MEKHPTMLQAATDKPCHSLRVCGHAGNYRCGYTSHLWMDCCICFQLTDCLCCTCSCSSESHYILSSHWHTVIAWGYTLNSQEIIHVATPLISACSSVHILINLKRSDLVSDLVLSGDSPWALTSLLWVNWILELGRKFQTYWTYKQNRIFCKHMYISAANWILLTIQPIVFNIVCGIYNLIAIWIYVCISYMYNFHGQQVLYF